MTLSLDEFLRRFLLHLLPEGFVRIRNFGFLANRKRATTLPLSFQLLGGTPQTEQQASTAGPSDLWSCPKGGGPRMVVERLTAAEIQLRLGRLSSRLPDTYQHGHPDRFPGADDGVRRVFISLLRS
jgi:hypothetical protein